jgi:hypothetical protein
MPSAVVSTLYRRPRSLACAIDGTRSGLRTRSLARGLYILVCAYAYFDYFSFFSIFLMTRALTHPWRSRIDRDRYEIHAKMAGHDNDRDGKGSNEEDGRRFQRPVDLCCPLSSPIVSPAAPYGRSADLSWRRRHSGLDLQKPPELKEEAPADRRRGGLFFFVLQSSNRKCWSRSPRRSQRGQFFEIVGILRMSPRQEASGL